MAVLLLGRVLFLGIHAVATAVLCARDAWAQRLGELLWKGLYLLVSLAGFVLIVWGCELRATDWRASNRCCSTACTVVFGTSALC